MPTAVVTGGASGFGLALVERIAGIGMDVALLHLDGAWAVNEVVRQALGKPIGGGTSTAAMAKMLQAKHTELNENQLVPGMIVISPTAGGND